MCELYSEEDKKLWDMLKNDPIIAAKFLAHLKTEEAVKQATIDNSFDDKISEAEYKCEGDR